MRLRYALAALMLLAAPAASAQDIDCAALPPTQTAEPPERARCHPPLVVAPASTSAERPAFGINLRSGGSPARGFISFDYANAATATLVAASTASYYAGDFAGDDFSKAYAISDANAFVSINTTTGVATPIGTATAPPGGQSYSGMAWDYTTGTMYVLSGTTGAATLHTINLATGATTVVAPVTVAGAIFINLLAHPTTGQLYAVDIAADNLYAINRTTGAATLIGPLGLTLNFAQGADFDNDTGVGYLCGYIGDGVNAVASLNLTTGEATVVGAFGNAEVDLCASMNPRSGTATEPAPSTGLGLRAEPNPFTSQTQLLVSVNEAQAVRVEVYDVTGRLVATLFDGQVNALSPTVVTLDAAALRSGVYVVRAVGERTVQTTQVTVVR